MGGLLCFNCRNKNKKKSDIKNKYRGNYSFNPHFDKNVRLALKELKKGTQLTIIKNGRNMTSTYRIDYDNDSFGIMSGKASDPWEFARFEQILDVELGENDVYEIDFKDQKTKHCFVVYFKDGRSPWLMTALSSQTRDLWVKGLKYLKAVSVTANDEKIARKAFEDTDQNSDQFLTYEEVLKLLHKMNIQPNRQKTLKLFQEARKTNIIIKNVEAINQEDFLTFYRSLHQREDLESLYLKYTMGKNFISTDNFYTFLRTAQCWHSVTMKDVLNVISKSLHKDEIRDVVSYDIFKDYLLSDSCQLFNQNHRRVYQDMSRPISDYYISTSHNTYLASSRLKGATDIHMYSHVLSSAGRCVVVECVDGQNNTPLVTCNWTCTNQISFEKVIDCINNYAFRTSPYPVIISLASRCSSEQRRVVANILKKKLMGKLWQPDRDNRRYVPSPLELKWKIIIHSRIENHPFLDELDKLVTLPTTRFYEEQVTQRAFSFVLLEESKFYQSTKHIKKTSSADLLQVLPKTRRVTFGGINPIKMWNEGVQSVPINWQTPGLPLQLNIGKFLDNGSSGYVLKPEILRSTTLYQNYRKSPRAQVNHICIEVISAHCLPKPAHDQKGEIIDPFVVLEIHGAPEDNCKLQTKTVDNNGFNPMWYEKLKFKVHVPELAQVLFIVYDKDSITANDFIGFYCLPFKSMEPGYRHMPLYDAYGNKMEKALLFVNVDLGEISKKMDAEFRKKSMIVYNNRFNVNKHSPKGSTNSSISFQSLEDFKDCD